MQHIYGANNKKINPDPFPICPVTRVVEVEKDDPREALRHGGKKVLATQKLEKNQVIGIYEGLEIFDFEQVNTKKQTRNSAARHCEKG